MSGSYSGRFSLRLLCITLCAVIGFSFAVCFSGTEDVYADGGIWANAYGEGDMDEGIVQFGLFGYNKGDVVKVHIETNKNEMGYNGYSGPKGFSLISCGETVIEANVTFVDESTYKITVRGTNCGSISVDQTHTVATLISSAATSTPTPTPSPTPKPKATNTPTPTPKPKATNTPTPTPKPKATNTPTPTPKPKATNTPTPTPKPKATNTPTPTPKPKATNTPTPTPKGKATNTPVPVLKATSTPTPKPKATNTPTPKPTSAPSNPTATESSKAQFEELTETKSTDASETVAGETTAETTAGTVADAGEQPSDANETVAGIDVSVNESSGIDESNNDAAVQTDENGETEPEATPVVVGLTATGKNSGGKKGPSVTSWLWIVILLLLAGLLYLRYRYLRDRKELEGKDLAIAFIPGIPLVAEKFGYLGPVKDMKPISEPQNKNAFNTANAMKEIKEMEKPFSSTATHGAVLTASDRPAQQRTTAAGQTNRPSDTKSNTTQPQKLSGGNSLSSNSPKLPSSNKTAAAAQAFQRLTDRNTTTSSNSNTSPFKSPAKQDKVSEQASSSAAKPADKSAAPVISAADAIKRANEQNKAKTRLQETSPFKKPEVKETATEKPPYPFKTPAGQSTASAATISAFKPAPEQKPVQESKNDAEQKISSGPIKRPKNELTPEQLKAREKAYKTLEERKAAQAARVEEIRRNAEAKKAQEAALAEEKARMEEAAKAEAAARAAELARQEEAAKAAEAARLAAAAQAEAEAKAAQARKMQEAAKAAERARIEEEQRKAEEARKAKEAAEAAERARIAEAEKAAEAARAAEKARQEEAAKVAEAARIAAAAKAEAEAKAAEAARLIEAAKAAEAARIAEEARAAEETRKAEELIKAEEARKAAAAKKAAALKEVEEAKIAAEARRAEEARRKEEAEKAEEARRAAELKKAEEDARAAEQARLAELAKAKEESEAAERARQEAAEAARAAEALKAEAEAKVAQARKAMEEADAAREAKAERAKHQSKTSEFFKTAMKTNDNGIVPGISALATVEGYPYGKDNEPEPAETPAGNAVRKNNPLSSFKSGSSSGVGANAAKDTGGPSISVERAKSSSNSNQLGTLLAGKQHNNSGRAPVWAAPAMAKVTPFKESDEAREMRMLEEQKRIEEETAKKLAEEKARSQYTSIADSATTHKSAFFKRSPNGRNQPNAEKDDHSSAYGGIVRPSAIVDEERDTRKTMTAPAMGAALEGQRPSIMDPTVRSIPTAAKPLAGFKPTDMEDNSDEDPSGYPSEEDGIV